MWSQISVSHKIVIDLVNVPMHVHVNDRATNTCNSGKTKG